MIRFANICLRRSVNLVPWRLRQVIRRMPVIASLQRIVIARFIDREQFEHVINMGPAAGLRLRIRLPWDKNLWTGTYESDFAKEIRNSIAPGNVCYDIGAFRGFMSGVMALANPKAVIAFEALAGNVAAIEELISLNPRLPIQVIPGAVGNRNGTVLFRKMGDASMGKIDDSVFQRDENAYEAFEVAMIRLDDLVATGKISPPDLIKIDVEGAELQVLEGLQTTIKRHHPIIFLEAHSAQLATDCSRMLSNFGYRGVPLTTSMHRENDIVHLKYT